MTDILIEFLEYNKINRIVDLLSEETYQDVLDWGKFYKKASCYHRVYKLKAGPETLINSSLFFLNEFMIAENSDRVLIHDRYMKKEYIDDPNEKILFEAGLRTTNKEVAREGINEVMPGLKKTFGDTWTCLPDNIKNQIKQSEYTYEINRDLRDYDFTAASICLSKAIEIWLKDRIVKPLIAVDKVGKLLKDAAEKQISLQKATLGNISYFLKSLEKNLGHDNWIRKDIFELFPHASRKDFLELACQIDMIAGQYRNSWVHAQAMPKTVYEEFRLKVPQWFMEWRIKWG